MKRDIHLPGLTLARGSKDMTKTYAQLAAEMERAGPNEYKPRRRSAYSVGDLLDIGQRALEKSQLDGDTVAEDDDMDYETTVEDLNIDK